MHELVLHARDLNNQLVAGDLNEGYFDEVSTTFLLVWYIGDYTVTIVK